MEQFEALKKIVKNNKEKYTIQEVMEVFAIVFEGYEKQSKTVKAIKGKITQGEWNSLINGLTMSFFTTLHAYHMPLDEAIKFAEIEGLISVAVMDKDKGK